MNIYSEKFVDTLVELMQEQNLNARQLEISTCIHRSVISRWLRGITIPSLNNLYILSDFFQCSIDYLFGLSDQKEFEKAQTPSNFQDRLNDLLLREHTTSYRVAKDLNFERSIFYKWNRGITPEILHIISLSQYFDVTVEYLLGRE